MAQFIELIKNWIEEPDFKDHNDNQSAFYIQVVALILIFGATTIALSYALAQQWNYVILIAIDIFVNCAILLMIRQKLLQPAINLFLIFTLAFLTYNILSVGGIHALTSVLYPVILIFAGLLLDRKSFIAYCTLCVSSVGIIVFAEYHHISPTYVPDPPHFPLFFAFSLMILGSALLIRFITESMQDNLRKTRQHEQELATQKEILDRVGQAVVACLPDNTIFYWNKAASSFYGWPIEEALGKKYSELMPVSASPETLEAISTDLRTGDVWSGELLIQKRDGTFLPTISTLAPLHDKYGKMSGWVGIAADLSERKQVEETLRESEDRFKSVFDHSVIGHSITRLTGEVQVNRAFCETVGYSPEEFKQRRWQEITHPDDIELTQKEIDSLLSGEKEMARFTKRFIHKNGSLVWVDLNSTLRRDKDGKPLYLMTSLVNITEQKQAEAFRVQAEAELRTGAMRQRLLDFNKELLTTVNDVEIFQVIQHIADDLLPHDIFLPYWVDEDARVFIPAEKPYQRRITIIFDPKWTIPFGKGILGDVALKQQAECVNNAHLDPRSVYPPEVRHQVGEEHAIFLPINEGGKVIGILVLVRRTLPPFTQKEFELAQLFMSQAELALSNARLFANLEQRVAERTAQLAASEERYRLISTVSSDYMFSSRLNEQNQLVLDWVAGAFESITGYTFEEYVAHGGWPAVLYPEDLEKDAQDMAALHTNRPVTTEVRTIAKDGQVRWVRVYAHPVWDTEKNQLAGIYGAVQDITAHKQAEKALRESEEKYRRLIEVSPVAMWINQDGIITYMNPAALRILGAAQLEQVVGRAAFDFIHPDYHAVVRERITEMVEQEKIVAPLQEKYVRLDGSFVDVEVTATPFTTTDGQAMQVFFQDITDRKQVEAREIHHREMLKKVIQLGKAITQITELEQCLRKIHQGVQKGLGFDRVGLFLYDRETGMVKGMLGTGSQGEIVGISSYSASIYVDKDWEDIISNPGGFRYLDDFQTYYNAPVKSDMRGVKEHIVISIWAGDLPVGFIAADNLLTQCPFEPEQIEALQLFAGYAGLAVQNARWNEELEKRVEKRTAELESANIELESLSYTIGHDLRSPIRAIVAYSHMLLEDLSGKLDTSHEQKLQQVNQVSLRMGHMVDDFLTFLMLGRAGIQRQPVDLNLLVQRVIDEFKGETADREVEFSILPMPDCLADFTLLKEVYSQLLDNALKFTVMRSPARIEIGAIEKEEETCYFIRDNGVGFDMRYINKIFGVFQRLHHLSEFDGVGAGLAIAQRIIQRHGGHIWAEAEVNKGATFYFTLAST